mmetsp:Transcript_5690/g.8250  ORF Transcript_5690/g.8250 Transcript_5690/m.8250 type:complete len:204 (-) Transcript_5690:3555-4166(-)
MCLIFWIAHVGNCVEMIDHRNLEYLNSLDDDLSHSRPCTYYSYYIDLEAYELRVGLVPASYKIVLEVMLDLDVIYLLVCFQHGNNSVLFDEILPTASHLMSSNKLSAVDKMQYLYHTKDFPCIVCPPGESPYYFLASLQNYLQYHQQLFVDVLGTEATLTVQDRTGNVYEELGHCGILIFRYVEKITNHLSDLQAVAQEGFLC